MQISSDVRDELQHRLETRLNNHLCEMKEGYDDSVVGFNEAWDVVRKFFDEISRSACPYCDRPVACADAPDCPFDDFTGGSFTEPVEPAPCAVCGEKRMGCGRTDCPEIQF